MTNQPMQKLITVAQYYQMAADGILQEDDPVELIEGHLHWLLPISPPQAAVGRYLTRTFILRLAEQVVVGPRNPIHLDDYSEPQLDLHLAQPPLSRYRTHHPTPTDLLLVIEVADTLLNYDRQTKAPLYARHGIPEYWIVNLAQETVEVYTQPQGGRYQQRIIRRRGEQVAPTAFPDLLISVDELFG